MNTYLSSLETRVANSLSKHGEGRRIAGVNIQILLKETRLTLDEIGLCLVALYAKGFLTFFSPEQSELKPASSVIFFTISKDFKNF